MLKQPAPVATDYLTAAAYHTAILAWRAQRTAEVQQGSRLAEIQELTQRILKAERRLLERRRAAARPSMVPPAITYEVISSIEAEIRRLRDKREALLAHQKQS